MSLVKEIIKDLLPEDEKKKVVAVYGGGFKPPTKGHFAVVKQAIKENPEIDEFIILVGGKDRDGVTQADSLMVWDIYKQYLPIMITVRSTSVPPIKGIYNYAKEHPNEEVLFIIGAREGNEDDFADIANRTKSLDKYPNLELRTIVTQGGVSGTAARNASKMSSEKLSPFLPNELTDEEKIEVYNIVSPNLREGASYSQDIDIKQKIKDLTQHMLDKGMNIRPLPKVIFKHGNVLNAKEFMGKTAYYDPNTMTIVLYTEGRHPKDIVRSFSHEMIHHIQNIEDRLGDIQGTNTMEDDHLDKLEQEANLKGTMTFRNWTDSLNEIGDLSQSPYKWSYSLDNSDDFNKEYSFTTKDSKYIVVFYGNKERNKWDLEFLASTGIGGSSSKTLTGGNEPFKIMSTVVDIVKDFLKQSSTPIKTISYFPTKGKRGEENAGDNTRAKLYKIIIQKNFPKAKIFGGDDVTIDVSAYSGNTNEAIIGNEVICDNCGWSWDIKEGGDDVYTCHKCGHDNTPLQEQKNKDPFGINAFARELAMLREEEGEYKIYVDMDGVVADFDKRFKDLSGMSPEEFESKYSKKEFWDLIDEKHKVSFWRGIELMPGAQELIDYVSKHDYEMLTAPSLKKQSVVGKSLWIKDQVGTLFSSTPKVNYRQAKLKHLIKPELTKFDILIDDRQDTINRWNSAGGTGILHTSAGNTISQLKKLKL